MRGEIDPQTSMFSYVDLESRFPKDHPIRKIRQIVDTALQEIEVWFDDLYASDGRRADAQTSAQRDVQCEVVHHSFCNFPVA